jgi:hypothetical protein
MGLSGSRAPTRQEIPEEILDTHKADRRCHQGPDGS